MNKPQGYEETQTSGDFTPPALGGHNMVIKQVNETKSKSGKDMIVVLFDFDQSDKQAGYFKKSFDDDIRPDKKWPSGGTSYILTDDAEGKCSRSFKTFITCIEHSNAGFTTQWGDNFASQFKGKKIGGNFGAEHYVNNKGEEKVSNKLRWFVSLDKVADVKIPDEKMLSDEDKAKVGGAVKDDNFVNVPADIDSELPFN